MNLFPPRCCDHLTAGPAPAEADRLPSADHPAACPRCAAIAERDATLSRVWEATRPVEPTDATWDAVWARVTSRLDGDAGSVPAPTVFRLPSPSRRWRRQGVAVLVAAQAAAVLAAAVLWSAHRPAAAPAVDGPEPNRVALLQADFEFNPGELSMLREEAGGLHAIILAQDDRTNAVDDNFAMFNFVESLAE